MEKTEEHTKLHVNCYQLTQPWTKIETSDDLDTHSATEKKTFFDVH